MAQNRTLPHEKLSSWTPQSMRDIPDVEAYLSAQASDPSIFAPMRALNPLKGARKIAELLYIVRPVIYGRAFSLSFYGSLSHL